MNIPNYIVGSILLGGVCWMAREILRVVTVEIFGVWPADWFRTMSRKVIRRIVRRHRPAFTLAAKCARKIAGDLFKMEGWSFGMHCKYVLAMTIMFPYLLMVNLAFRASIRSEKKCDRAARLARHRVASATSNCGQCLQQ